MLLSTSSSVGFAKNVAQKPLASAHVRVPRTQSSVAAVGSCSTSASRSVISACNVKRNRGDGGVCNVARREGVFLFGFGGNDDDYEEDYTVCKLQVGIFGDINTWQSKVNRIAMQYQTDDPEGLHSVFTDSLMLVLRNMEYVGYAASAGKVFHSIEETEQKFNSVLLEERLKFKEETLTNIDGRKKSRALEAKGGDGGMDRWLCMTLLMAVEGKIKIPQVNTGWELKKVLTELGGLSADDLIAFELLWTPQDKDDSYSKQELLTDYPDMITLS